MLYAVLSRTSGQQEADTHQDTMRERVFVFRKDMDRDWKWQGTLLETNKAHFLFKCHVILPS